MNTNKSRQEKGKEIALKSDLIRLSEPLPRSFPDYKQRL